MKNPFSKEAFLDFVEKKPPEEPYNFMSLSNCAIAQYLKSLGITDKLEITGIYAKHFSYGMTGSPIGKAAALSETFGQLAERLR